MKTFIFFNNKGGVGKTTLAYHFTYMLAEFGYRCLAVDLDPQTNLTSMFLSDEELGRIYEPETTTETLLEGLRQIQRGTGDITDVQIHEISNSNTIGLLAGNLNLSLFEDLLSESWVNCLDRREDAFRKVSALYRIIQQAGEIWQSDYAVIDVGPNFGALNRVTLISADYVIVPVGADLFSLQGLRNLGEQLKRWKEEWAERLHKSPVPQTELNLPDAAINPLGYVLMQYRSMAKRPVYAYLNWANRIPLYFDQYVLNIPEEAISKKSIENDINCLAMLKHYHSLVPMAMEVRKPIFHLRPADGAIGAHSNAAHQAYQDFKLLTQRIINQTKVGLSDQGC